MHQNHLKSSQVGIRLRMLLFGSDVSSPFWPRNPQMGTFNVERNSVGTSRVLEATWCWYCFRNYGSMKYIYIYLYNIKYAQNIYALHIRHM